MHFSSDSRSENTLLPFPTHDNHGLQGSIMRCPARLYDDRPGGEPRLTDRGSHQAAVAARPGLPRLRASLPAPPRPLGFHTVLRSGRRQRAVTLVTVE